jgi:hypothetical protein
VTRIHLNNDSTFGYRMSGDVIFDTSNGKYSLKHNYVILYHQRFKPDTSTFGDLLNNSLSVNKHLHNPEKYLIRHKKLFVCDSTGTIVRKQFGYSKRRKYILFGNHWHKQRYYLKKVD